MSAAGFTHRKRRAKVEPVAESEVDDVTAELQQLRLFRDQLMQPLETAGGFDLQRHSEKERLARQLWSGDFLQCMGELREANPALITVLSQQISNSYDRRASAEQLAKKDRRIDGVLISLSRAQSKFNMTAITAALSVLAEANQVPREFWLATCHFFAGPLATEAWTADLLNVARTLRPPPPYVQLEGVAAGAFDNLSMRMNYGSYVREGGGGELKHMTNWFYTTLPRNLAPATFDADAVFRRGMFREDRSLSTFCRSFYLSHPDIAASRAGRWPKWLGRIKDGSLLHRPRVPPTWRPHKVYQPPIFDRLQSSYDDVREELNIMRAAFPTASFPTLRFLFVGGDGLSLMRMNHLLASEPDVYLHSTPAIIPVQGEHPHGLFHGLHCQWRLFRPFIMKCAAVVGNEQVKEDRTVSDFNVSRFFFVDILTRACGEYLIELAGDNPAADWDDPDLFIAKVEGNVNFEWLVHFLHDAAFWVVEFLDSVRGFDSRKIDVLWREFFASAHTGSAHKTQYVGMAILRAFWGQALESDLDELYHAMRCVPSGTHDGCGVGWDWVCELLNGAIKSHVDMHVSEEQIRKFISNWALLETVQRHLRDVLYANRAERYWRGRNGKPAKSGKVASGGASHTHPRARRRLATNWACPTGPWQATLAVCLLSVGPRHVCHSLQIRVFARFRRFRSGRGRGDTQGVLSHDHRQHVGGGDAPDDDAQGHHRDGPAEAAVEGDRRAHAAPRRGGAARLRPKIRLSNDAVLLCLASVMCCSCVEIQLISTQHIHHTHIAHTAQPPGGEISKLAQTRGKRAENASARLIGGLDMEDCCCRCRARRRGRARARS